MKVLATLKNVNSESCKGLIIRNLSRILDIKIIDIDVEHGMISFIYNAQDSFNQVKKELLRIGFPIKNSTSLFSADNQFSNSTYSSTTELSFRARKPYFKISQ